MASDSARSIFNAQLQLKLGRQVTSDVIRALRSAIRQSDRLSEPCSLFFSRTFNKILRGH